MSNYANRSKNFMKMEKKEDERSQIFEDRLLSELKKIIKIENPFVNFWINSLINIAYIQTLPLKI